MDQIITGIRRVLSYPLIYDTFQSMVGGVAARRRVCAQYIKATASDTIVDVGCGTAELLGFLPEDVRYHGFDLSQKYIDAATARHAKRRNCSFKCADLNDVAPEEIPLCSIAIVFGVLHHIGDDAAKRLLLGLHGRLAPGGRVIAIDPAFIDEQALIARELIRRDRGQNVRRPEDYLALAPDIYDRKTIVVRHDLMHVPYTLAILECSKN